MPTLIDDYTPVNYERGRGGLVPRAIVVHITDSSPSDFSPDGGAVGWFRNPVSEVSAHYVARIDGAIARVVREADTAWANGVVKAPDLGNPLVARWVRQSINPNRETISIEIAGRPGGAKPAAQWAAVVWLVADICRRQGIARDRDHIIGHYQIDSVTRARCPSLTDVQWGELTMPAPDDTDAALEAAYRQQGAMLGAKRFKGRVDRPYYAGDVLVCDNGILRADGKRLAYGPGAVDDLTTYWEAANVLVRY